MSLAALSLMGSMTTVITFELCGLLLQIEPFESRAVMVTMAVTASGSSDSKRNFRERRTAANSAELAGPLRVIVLFTSKVEDIFPIGISNCRPT